MKKLTARLIKLEKNLKQSEEEKLSDALVSVKGEQEKLEEAEDHAFPVRDNRKIKQNQDKRRCWECGDDSHIRSKCRVFKRRLERGPSQEATFQDASNKEATGFLVIPKAITKNDHKATGGFLLLKNITRRWQTQYETLTNNNIRVPVFSVESR